MPTEDRKPRVAESDARAADGKLRVSCSLPLTPTATLHSSPPSGRARPLDPVRGRAQPRRDVRRHHRAARFLVERRSLRGPPRRPPSRGGLAVQATDGLLLGGLNLALPLLGHTLSNGGRPGAGRPPGARRPTPCSPRKLRNPGTFLPPHGHVPPAPHPPRRTPALLDYGGPLGYEQPTFSSPGSRDSKVGRCSAHFSLF